MLEKKISIQTSSSVTDGGTQRTNYEREDIGLTLKSKNLEFQVTQNLL